MAVICLICQRVLTGEPWPLSARNNDREGRKGIGKKVAPEMVERESKGTSYLPDGLDSQ